MIWRLALVQLFFTLSWTVYVIFLPGLFKQAGIELHWLPWLLIVDQLIFAAMDIGLGVWLDRSQQLLDKVRNCFLAAVVISCAVFMALPWLAGNVPSGLFVVAVIVWVVCSSVLRVPPLFFMSKAVAANHAEGKTMPIGVAGYFFGIGVAGALAPYLTITLKNIDPLLPFVLASAALLAATLALRPMLANQTNADTAAKLPMPQVLNIDFKLALPLLLAVALFASGVQLHVAVNSAKYFTAAHPGASLEWLMPLFWVGFSVAMFPASQWLKHGADADNLLAQIAYATQTMLLAGLVGSLTLFVCVFTTSLGTLIALQILAGAAWATVMLALFSAVSAMGKACAPSETGLWLGAALALMALATAGRIALVLMLSSNPSLASFKLELPWMTALGWTLAAVLIFVFTRVLRRAESSN